MASLTIAAMDGNNPTPAAHAVFQTTELVENIVLFLPLKDLLLAQNICKFFKACIEGSIKAQTALYYNPAGSDLLHWETTGDSRFHDVAKGSWIHVKDGRSTRPVINPLMRRFIVTRGKDLTSILHLGYPVCDWSQYAGATPGSESQKASEVLVNEWEKAMHSSR